MKLTALKVVMSQFSLSVATLTILLENVSNTNFCLYLSQQTTTVSTPTAMIKKCEDNTVCQISLSVLLLSGFVFPPSDCYTQCGITVSAGEQTPCPPSSPSPPRKAFFDFHLFPVSLVSPSSAVSSWSEVSGSEPGACWDSCHGIYTQTILNCRCGLSVLAELQMLETHSLLNDTKYYIFHVSGFLLHRLH